MPGLAWRSGRMIGEGNRPSNCDPPDPLQSPNSGKPGNSIFRALIGDRGAIGQISTTKAQTKKERKIEKREREGEREKEKIKRERDPQKRERENIKRRD